MGALILTMPAIVPPKPVGQVIAFNNKDYLLIYSREEIYLLSATLNDDSSAPVQQTIDGKVKLLWQTKISIDSFAHKYKQIACTHGTLLVYLWRWKVRFDNMGVLVFFDSSRAYYGAELLISQSFCMVDSNQAGQSLENLISNQKYLLENLFR
jgi:hypothetical protein